MTYSRFCNVIDKDGKWVGVLDRNVLDPWCGIDAPHFCVPVPCKMVALYSDSRLEDIEYASKASYLRVMFRKVDLPIYEGETRAASQYYEYYRRELANLRHLKAHDEIPEDFWAHKAFIKLPKDNSI